VPRRVVAAHLACAVGRQLEHLVVEQEEPVEAEPADQRQLLVEPVSCSLLRSVELGVPLGECPVAKAPELDARRFAVGEVGIAVAEVGGEVETQPVGKLAGAVDGVVVVGETLAHVVGREEHRFVVAATLGLGAVERRALADRDEHVLQLRATRMVRVHVPGRDRLSAERPGEVAQRRVPPDVAALVRSLQLDEEALPERPCDRRRGVRVAHAEPVSRAAGETDEPVVQLEQELDRQRRVERRVLGPEPRPRVRRGQQPAEVRVAARVLHEQGDVRAPFERHLGPGDRAHAERLRRVRELERAVDPVVVGERERLVAKLGRAQRELFR
jgi:hypothetical protein